jgi:hypothetical protein
MRTRAAPPRARSRPTPRVLAASKVDEARRVVDRYVADTGRATLAALKETTRPAAARRPARPPSRGREGRGGRHGPHGREAPEKMPGKALLARAGSPAPGRARAGDAAAAKAAAAEAAGGEPDRRDRPRARADALTARKARRRRDRAPGRAAHRGSRWPTATTPVTPRARCRRGAPRTHGVARDGPPPNARLGGAQAVRAHGVGRDPPRDRPRASGATRRTPLRRAGPLGRRGAGERRARTVGRPTARSPTASAPRSRA